MKLLPATNCATPPYHNATLNTVAERELSTNTPALNTERINVVNANPASPNAPGLASMR
jgi:hypothetical protein